MSLEEWNAKFGGEPGMDPFANDRGRRGFEYETGTAYLVRLKKATLVRDTYGNEQLRFSVAVMGHDAEDAPEVGESLEHITLPWQEGDKGMARDVRERVLRMRVDTLKHIYSAAIPSQYAPYDKTDADPATNKKRYLDFNGQPLTQGRYEERQQQINERLMVTLEALKSRLEGEGGEVEELADTFLYLHKKAHKVPGRRPYTNFHAQRPAKLPIYAGVETEEAPF